MIAEVEGRIQQSMQPRSGSVRRGYGFIKQDDGEDLFVHYTGIKGIGFRSLTEGQRVRFEIESSSKGFKANNVELV